MVKFQAESEGVLQDYHSGCYLAHGHMSPLLTRRLNSCHCPFHHQRSSYLQSVIGMGFGVSVVGSGVGVGVAFGSGVGCFFFQYSSKPGGLGFLTRLPVCGSLYSTWSSSPGIGFNFLNGSSVPSGRPLWRRSPFPAMAPPSPACEPHAIAPSQPWSVPGGRRSVTSGGYVVSTWPLMSELMAAA